MQIRMVGQSISPSKSSGISRLTNDCTTMGKHKHRNRHTKPKGAKKAHTSGTATTPIDAQEEPFLDQANLALLESIRHNALHKTSSKKRRAPPSEDEEEPDPDTMVTEGKSGSNALSARLPVKNSAAVVKRLEEIKLDLPFVEKLSVTGEVGLDVADVEDDLKREVEFYNQALRAVKRGRAALDGAKVAHMRPVDYFAEMVKSDEHMSRVKQQLLFEKQKMESFEKRKQQKEYKKYAKQMQAEKQKLKAEKKRKSKEVAEEFKSNRSDVVSRKRMAKDRKFGFGGKKRAKKKNDAQSTNDMSGFSIKKNKAAFPGMKTKGRPGKSKRQRR